MKKSLIGIIVFLMLLCNIRAQVLSDSAKISLLTCGSGEELYSVFGHSALRVYDPAKKLDLVYNYGMFDFNTPNFYIKFANGNLNYLLAVGRFKYFLPEYFSEHRWVKEQELNLDVTERQKLFDALQLNAKPENRNYRYDFFFDNCATRLRDQVFNAVNGNVVLKDSVGQGLTYRELYGSYLKKSPWIEFGIHLLLGAKADLKSDAWHEMYLPDYLYYQFQNSTIQGIDGKTKPLVKKSEELISFNDVKTDNSTVTPSIFFGGVFVLTLLITFFEFKRKNRFIIIDLIIFGTTGLAALLFIFLWFFTRHGVTAQNYNLMWAMPTNLLLIVLLRLKSEKFINITKVLTWLTASIALIFVMSMLLLPQVFPNGLIYLVLTIIIRLVFHLLNRGWILNKLKY